MYSIWLAFLSLVWWEAFLLPCTHVVLLWWGRWCYLIIYWNKWLCIGLPSFLMSFFACIVLHCFLHVIPFDFTLILFSADRFLVAANESCKDGAEFTRGKRLNYGVSPLLELLVPGQALYLHYPFAAQLHWQSVLINGRLHSFFFLLNSKCVPASK